MTLADISRVQIKRQYPFVLGLQAVMGLAALVSIPIFGAWAILWSFVTLLPLIMVCDGLKRIYWRGFDPFIWEAGQTGRFKKMMFWNVLTHTLDWLFDAVPMAVGGYIVFKLVEGTSLPPAVAWCVFALCCYPPRLYLSQLPSPKTNLYSFMTIALPVAFVCVSLVYPLAPLVMAVACIGVLPVLVVIRTYQELPNHRRDYEDLMRDSERNMVRSPVWDRSWFPRPGVVFEPQFNKYGGYKVAAFQDIQPSLTILRINWCGMFLALGLMVFGIVRVATLGHSLLILFAPLVIAMGLIYGSVASEADRKMMNDDASVRFAFSLFALAVMAVPTLYFGGQDLPLLLAAGALFVGYWFFFFGFMVRATSRGVFDTMELLVVIAALATVIAARVCFKCVWWEALLPVMGFSVAYGYFRSWFPRRDIPEVKDEATGNGGEKSGVAAGDSVAAAKKDRRERKRERQMAAFRRSKRG